MEPRPIQFVLDACAAQLYGGKPNSTFTGICTDSRSLKPGDLFVALQGEHFDGHAFLADAAAKGAAAAMVNHEKFLTLPSPSLPLIPVPNTRAALSQIAARHRLDFNIPIVAVAGSNGKTTTKDLITSVLSQKFKVAASEASFNNAIGVPLTLFKLEQSHQAAVLEVGTNHPGELKPLLDLIQPKFGVLSCIGREHLEFFQTLEGVIAEESWLAKILPKSGILFLNNDSPGAQTIAQLTHASVVRIGTAHHSDWKPTHVQLHENGLQFSVVPPFAPGPQLTPGFDGPYTVRLLGRHQVSNALLAIAVGGAFGLTPDQIKNGLALCPPPKMRLQLINLPNGCRILDDAYNANADSVRCALNALCDLPTPGKRIAILGDMAELGRHTADAHDEIGRYSALLPVDCLVTVGFWSEVTAQAAQSAGLKNILKFADPDQVAPALSPMIGPGDLILVKASRASRLERIISSLKNQQAESQPNPPT